MGERQGSFAFVAEAGNEDPEMTRRLSQVAHEKQETAVSHHDR